MLITIGGKVMKKVQRIEELSDKDIDRVLEVWESSVRATHDFLDEQAIVDLIPQVKQGIQYVETFLVIKSTEDLIIGFAGIYESKIEMLFVHDDNRKQGIGKSLLLACINDYRVTLVDVNEQNPQAVGFYQHLGFNVISRSEKDDAGNPYPILHLSL